MKGNTTQPNESEPRLPGHDGKHPFQVPEGYFDSLESRIMDKVAREEKPQPTPRGKRALLYRWAVPAVAASLLALMLFVGKTGQQTEMPDDTELLASLTDQEMIDYLYQSGMYVEEIAETNPEALPSEVDILPDTEEITDEMLEEELLYGDLYDLI